MDPRSALTALGFSIAIHVSAGAVFHAPAPLRAGVPDDAIFLTSVRYAEPKTNVSSEAIPSKKDYLQLPLVVKRGAIPASAQTAISHGIMRADELAASPDKGKVFALYFGGIRQKINEAVKARFAGEGEGKVTILFILSETGKLQSSAVIDGQTEADLIAKRLVLEAVREAAPFSVFPAELGTGRIAFTLTILFQEN